MRPETQIVENNDSDGRWHWAVRYSLWTVILILIVITVFFWKPWGSRNADIVEADSTSLKKNVDVEPGSPLAKMLELGGSWSAVIGLSYSPSVYEVLNGTDTTFEVAFASFYQETPTKAAELYFKGIRPKFDGDVVVIPHEKKKNFHLKEEIEQSLQREHVIAFQVSPMTDVTLDMFETQNFSSGEMKLLATLKRSSPQARNWRIIAKPDPPKESNLLHGLPVGDKKNASSVASSSTLQSKQQSSWKKTRTIRATEPVSMSSCCSSGSSNDNTGTLPASAWRRNN